jgi:hypothetical protein
VSPNECFPILVRKRYGKPRLRCWPGLTASVRSSIRLHSISCSKWNERASNSAPQLNRVSSSGLCDADIDFVVVGEMDDRYKGP